MAVKIRIPVPLRSLTQGQEIVDTDGASIKALIDNLETKFPGIKGRICDDQGNVRRFVNIYVNEEDIRFMAGINTPVNETDDISIIPAIAGGK